MSYSKVIFVSLFPSTVVVLTFPLLKLVYSTVLPSVSVLETSQPAALVILFADFPKSLVTIIFLASYL